MFVNKNILLISPEPWNHIFVSKHHYATHLAKLGNKVFFLNPPTKSNAVLDTEFENVYSVTYTGFVKGLRFFPGSIQKYWIRKKFNFLQDLCGVKFDIIWSFDNSVFFDFSALPKKILKISHIVDYSQDFQTKRAAKTADFNFCTSEKILERLQKYNSNSFKIHHGYHMTKVKLVKLPGHQEIKAVYAGNLSIQFIDWTTLLLCVKKNPHIDFCFIGPGADSIFIEEYINELSKMENCYFINQLSSEDLQSHYASADLLLLCYKEGFQSQLANPHKVMEYLGSGKIVVATPTEEYRTNNLLVAMPLLNSEYPELLRNVSENLDTYNNPILFKQRIAFALENTYENQIQKIENIISSK